MRGHGVINAARQQNLHQLDVVGIDFFLAGKCDLRGLFVGALDQADAAADAQQVPDILFAPVEIGLNDGSHGIGFRAGLLDDAKRSIGICRTFHIDAHEISQFRRAPRHDAQLVRAELVAEIEAQMRQLEGNIRVEVFGCDAVERVRYTTARARSASSRSSTFSPR